MLSLHLAQIKSLGAYTRERFVTTMVRHLRHSFPQRSSGLDDERMRALVRGGIVQAEGHHVVYEDDIRRYLEYLAIYGTPLERQPQAQWIAEILGRDDIDGSEKLDLIDARELARVRGEA